jgi:hypothetical protein
MGFTVSIRYEVVIHFLVVSELDDGGMDEAAIDVLEMLKAEAANVALGPAARVDYNDGIIEVALTVEGDSGAELHRKLAEVLALLGEKSELEYRDARTSRLDPVPA